MTGRALRFLLAHDLRLAWRDARGAFRRLGDGPLAVLVVVLAAAVHAAAWFMARPGLDLAPGTGFVMLLMTAQTLNAASKLVYGRGDLDLILASPFPARVLLLVRGLALALGAAASAAIFVAPLADVGLARGDWRAGALYPALVAGALVATGLSLLLALGLLAVVGPRRTRMAAQIVATFIGGGFVIWFQVSRFVRPGPALFARPWPAWAGRIAALPVRAAEGDPASLAAWVAFALVFYGGVALALGGAFTRSVQAVAVVPDIAPKRRAGGGFDRPFAASLGAALRAKELRLLRRDPWILSQLLQQVLYMLPLLVGLWTGTGGNGPLTLAPVVVVVSFQVAASLTWLSLAGEDAPDLLATAPVTGRALRGAKLATVGLIVAVLAALPLAWLAVLDPGAAPGTVALSALAVRAATLLGSWYAAPAKRSSFAARHRESKLMALVEMVMSALLGLAAAVLATGSAWTVLPLGAAGAVLLAARPRRGRRRSRDEQAASARESGQQAA